MFALNFPLCRWLLPFLAGVWLALPAVAAEMPDLPPCETLAGKAAPGLSIGIAQPYAAQEVVAYAAGLARQSEAVAVCMEPWDAVLPRLAPWAGHLERGYGLAAFLLVFLLSVALLSRYTPRDWWRRTTLVGVLAVAGMTWVLGVAVLAAFHAVGGQRLAYGTVVNLRPAQQPVGEWLDVGGARELEAILAQRALLPEPSESLPVAALKPVGKASPSGGYRVFHRLNLREGPGIESARIAVLNVGEVVSYDGAAQGDWWRIRTATGTTGWASSIWLRRPDEAILMASGGRE